ncbi:MAG TPA: response regulator [Thermomicrobiales bacterium]|jgi:two-component system, OmpR family, response regulator|nr:response regulator [Thermomicrobiales bacterium]
MSERPLAEARQQHERPHVLVVTDDLDLTAFLEEGLPLGGFWMSAIASGLQALEVFRLRQFDLVLIDLDLESFRALELIRRLRGQSDRVADRTPRTFAPIVTISSFDTLDEADRMRLGIADSMKAPIDIEDVVRRLHETFAAWRQANPDALLADAASRDAASRAR